MIVRERQESSGLLTKVIFQTRGTSSIIDGFTVESKVQGARQTGWNEKKGFGIYSSSNITCVIVEDV